jgi:hypothetical protein
MPYTEQQIQALREAVASGARRVRFADREIEYRSVDELQRVLAAAEAETAPVVRHIRVHTSKGF